MRGSKRDWAGVVQGNLTVLSEAEGRKHGNVCWNCICECGTYCTKSNNALGGGVKSCSPTCGVGRSNKARTIHGMHKSKEYHVWQAIKQRCYNEANESYKSYGGRGIKVCDDWVNNFEVFLSDVGEAPEGKRVSLDRINNDGNYEPRNVQWATPKMQANNRRTNVRVSVGNFTGTLAQIAREFDQTYSAVSGRYRRGLRGKELITKQPVGWHSQKRNK